MRQQRINSLPPKNIFSILQHIFDFTQNLGQTLEVEGGTLCSLFPTVWFLFHTNAKKRKFSFRLNLRFSTDCKDSCCGCPYFSLETTTAAEDLNFLDSLFFETDNIVRCASDDVTQLLHCEQCNVFVLLQRIKRFIVDPVLQKIILRDIPLLHRFPKRAEINQTVHHLFPRFSM